MASIGMTSVASKNNNNTTANPAQATLTTSSNTATIVGSVLGVLLFIILVVVGLIIWRRRRREKPLANPEMVTAMKESDDVKSVEAGFLVARSGSRTDSSTERGNSEIGILVTESRSQSDAYTIKMDQVEPENAISELRYDLDANAREKLVQDIASRASSANPSTVEYVQNEPALIAPNPPEQREQTMAERIHGLLEPKEIIPDPPARGAMSRGVANVMKSSLNPSRASLDSLANEVFVTPPGSAESIDEIIPGAGSSTSFSSTPANRKSLFQSASSLADLGKISSATSPFQSPPVTPAIIRKSTAKRATHAAVHAFHPSATDEIGLDAGDLLHCVKAFEDGWLRVQNLTCKEEGIVPGVCVKALEGGAVSKAKILTVMGGSSENLTVKEDAPTSITWAPRTDSLGQDETEDD
ncbi:hypothetical protein BC830DRAFT_1085974 [Chytriomyces sp. MP71]|nr:hypothetical protein BC830DRAFT_1085974 [Chytriomyces sp. MP71]